MGNEIDRKIDVTVILLDDEIDKNIDVTVILFLLVKNRLKTHERTLIGSGANGRGIQTNFLIFLSDVLNLS